MEEGIDQRYWSSEEQIREKGPAGMIKEKVG